VDCGGVGKTDLFAFGNDNTTIYHGVLTKLAGVTQVERYEWLGQEGSLVWSGKPGADGEPARVSGSVYPTGVPRDLEASDEKRREAAGG
jgi:hypothetical protein